jgi:transposase
MPALTLRARIVLECAKGKDNAQVATELGISVAMVGRWLRRFVESRMRALMGSLVAGRGPPNRAHITLYRWTLVAHEAF